MAEKLIRMPSSKPLPLNAPSRGLVFGARVWIGGLLWVPASFALAATLVWGAILALVGREEFATVHGVANVGLFLGVLVCFGSAVLSVKRIPGARWLSVAVAVVVVLTGWIVWAYLLPANVPTLGMEDRKPMGIATLASITCVLAASAAMIRPQRRH